MEKRVFSIKENKTIRIEQDEPKCGEAFCENCGDCLYCYGDDECFNGPYHLWVEYID